MYPLLFGRLGLTEILIILLIVVLFFGGKKIPELMRGMGHGVREFKDALQNPPAESADDATAKTPKAPKSAARKPRKKQPAGTAAAKTGPAKTAAASTSGAKKRTASGKKPAAKKTADA